MLGWVLNFFFVETGRRTNAIKITVIRNERVLIAIKIDKRKSRVQEAEVKKKRK